MAERRRRKARRNEETVEPDDVLAPHNLEVERSVLGAMLLHTGAAVYATERLEADDFWRDAHRQIFAAMQTLVETKRPVDLPILREELRRRRGGLPDTTHEDEVGGPAYMAALVDGVPRSSNIEAYCNLLADLKLRRNLLDVSRRLAAEVVAYDCDGKAIAADAEGWLADAVKERGARELQPQDDIVATFLPKLEARVAARATLAGVPTGLTQVDALTRGFHPEELTVLAGRPSMGKSAIALNMAEAAANAQFFAAFFSCEMSKEQLEYRLVASRSRVPLIKILNGWLQDTDLQAISRALQELSQLPLYIDDTPGLTMAQIRSKCRALQAARGLGIVFIDYVQLLRPRHERPDNRQGEVAEISFDVKTLTRTLRVPVVALSQLSRKLEERRNKRPMLSDLRESGALEQDADNVAFVYRQEVYSQKAEDVGDAEYILAKHRQGDLGTVDLLFKKEIVKFHDAEATPAETAYRRVQADVPEPPPHEDGDLYR